MNENRLVNIVRGLERIKSNLPKYKEYPEIIKHLEKKQSSYEEEFLDKLQDIRLREGANQRYTMYANWYKKHKGVEHI